MTNSSGKFAWAAIGCGLAGFPLVLLSYSWVPFASAGREMGSWSFLPLVSEVGALLAAIVAIFLGRLARQRAQPGIIAEHRLASRGLALGVGLLALIVVPNLVGGLMMR